MNFILADGFDNYTDPSLKGTSTGLTLGTILTTGGRDGRGCFYGNTGKIGKTISPIAEVIVGFAVKAQDTTGTTGSGSVCAIASGVNDLISVQYRKPYFQIVHSQAGTVYGVASTIPVDEYAWAYVELRFKVTTSTAVGDIVLKVNNQVGVTAAAGFNTTWASATTVDTVWFGSICGAVNAFDAYIDDVVVLPASTGFWGDVVVEGRYASADGDLSQWLPSGAATNHGCVNEAEPDGDTTYVSSSSFTARDTYKFGPLNQVPADVKGVQLSLDAEKVGNDAIGIVPFFRQAGVNYDQTKVDLTTSYAMTLVPFDTNPATGEAWTEGEIDDLEMGMILTS